MRLFAEQLDHILRRSESICLAMLVEVRGSMPQEPGVTMLIRPDGTTLGSIGGGSADAEIIRASREQLNSSTLGAQKKSAAQFVSLTRKSAASETGLNCSDQMTVLLETIGPDDDLTYFQSLRTAIMNSQGVTEAIVLNRQSSRGPSNRYLFDEIGQLLATRSHDEQHDAPTVEGLRKSLRSLSKRPTSYTVDEVLYIPRLKQIRLLMFGAGHVSQRVAELACNVGFDIWVVDDRPEYCQPTRFPLAQRLIVSTIDEAMPSLAIDSNTYCLILNRTHERDEQTLRQLIGFPAGYIGLIGSRRKIRRIFDDLMAEGVMKSQLQAVHAPVGINIGSRAINEIAISILAELIACRNLGAVPNRRTIFDSEPTVSE